MSSASMIRRLRVGVAPEAVTAMIPVEAIPHTQNRLIAALPIELYDRLSPNLLPAMLALGDVIYEPGARQDYVYFPAGAVVSFFNTTADGATVAIGMVGDDGIVGIALLLGGGTAIFGAIVQIAGRAFKMRARVLQDEFGRGGPVQRILLRYTQSFLTQLSQTAVCNRLHPVEKRLCRWLLLSHDRAHSDRLSLTQEFISNMLGSRRESVTVAAARLQDAGLIHYSRGTITILDRAGLESAACECYPTLRDEYERLLYSRQHFGISA
jgi:CRP-like cAMP-binding protein